jgi:DNA ligase 1
MQAFGALLEKLVLTPQRNGKLALLEAYLRATPDPDRGWAIASLTGTLDLKSLKPASIQRLIAERMDPELFRLSYDFVGDLAETVSLVWPHTHGQNRAPQLGEIVEALEGASRSDAERRLALWLDALDATGRWALLKLITGGLRIGVSQRMAKQALANYGDQPVEAIEEIWHGLAPPFGSLFDWLDGRGPKPQADFAARFRPVMLAHPLFEKSERASTQDTPPDFLTPDSFAAEWKFDGIRVQAVSESGTRRLYTRTGDDISHTFPDLIAAMAFEGALDGELLVRGADGGLASFNDLQQRLNRKTVTKAQMDGAPAYLCAYDALQLGGDDLRARPFRERRAALEAFVLGHASDRLTLSPLVSFSSFADLARARLSPPSPSIEGLMLKRWDSPYLAGRVTGHWYKWKRDPYLIDAVLLYAQRGHGKRSGFYSDFTFGVWKDDALTPVGKAYFGFTDEELKELDKFVRTHTIDRFGPVRSVEAKLVLEVAFEGLQRSPRHKSGVAMRFPRIHRIRWDKPAEEADTLETLERLIDT